MSAFSNQLLKAEPWRYAIIAEAVLPALIIGTGAIFFSPTANAGAVVVGRPAGAAFGVIWVVIVLIWTIALVLAACNFRKNLALFGLLVLSLFCLIACFVWLVLYKQTKKEIAYFALIMATAFMIAAAFCTSTTESVSSNAKTGATVAFGLISTWLILASNFAIIELNKSTTTA